jgi:hypothetical protein
MKGLAKIGVVGLISLVALLFSACSDENTARVEVRLTDAPGDFEELNIDIQEVQINGGDGNSGWQSLDIEAGVYNILELTNGLDTLLGSIELPAGKIEQIRLVLGNENSVVIDGESYPISTPSAQQSGLKLNLHATLVEGVTYRILLDFDAARSVVEQGNHMYSLKPVIRAIEEATTGAIKGTVTPAESKPVVYAIAGIDTVGTTFADTTTGVFLIKGLEAGTYTVSLSPITGFTTVNKTEVSVSVGSVTNLGTVEIP